jgi:hypothetical protein
MPVAKQQIPNTYQWTNCEAVFSKRSVRRTLVATIELLEVVFYAVRAEVLQEEQI